MRNLASLLLAASLTLAAAAAFAHEYTLGGLTIDHPWTRATVSVARTAGGYMTIENTGSEPDRLLGGSTPAAETVEVHQMTTTDGVMRMRPVEGGLEIPAGGSVTLAPGGYHLMVMGLSEPFIEGARIPLTLSFEKAGAVDVELAVEPLAADAAGEHEGH